MSDTPKAIRSPSYPSVPLSEAVAAVAKIERSYRSATVDRLSVAKLIGYSALSGPAQKAVADLFAYGLLERAGKGEARVTERARDILHPSSDQDRKAKLRAAALDPPLYRDLIERFSGMSVPPEDGVVTYLNRQGFNPNAVRPAAKAFLQTMSYLEELGASDSDGAAAVADEDRAESTADGDGPMETADQTRPQKLSFLQAAAEMARASAEAQTGFRREVFALDEGDVVLTFPENLSAASFHDLDDHLRIFLRKAQRRAGLGDFFAEVYAPDGIRLRKVEYFSEFTDLMQFIEQHKASAPHAILRAHLPARAAPSEWQALSSAGIERAKGPPY